MKKKKKRADSPRARLKFLRLSKQRPGCFTAPPSCTGTPSRTISFNNQPPPPPPLQVAADSYWLATAPPHSSDASRAARGGKKGACPSRADPSALQTHLARPLTPGFCLCPALPSHRHLKLEAGAVGKQRERGEEEFPAAPVKEKRERKKKERKRDRRAT